MNRYHRVMGCFNSRHDTTSSTIRGESTLDSSLEEWLREELRRLPRHESTQIWGEITQSVLPDFHLHFLYAWLSWSFLPKKVVLSILVFMTPETFMRRVIIMSPLIRGSRFSLSLPKTLSRKLSHDFLSHDQLEYLKILHDYPPTLYTHDVHVFQVQGHQEVDHGMHESCLLTLPSLLSRKSIWPYKKTVLIIEPRNTMPMDRRGITA